MSVQPKATDHETAHMEQLRLLEEEAETLRVALEDAEAHLTQSEERAERLAQIVGNRNRQLAQLQSQLSKLREQNQGLRLDLDRALAERQASFERTLEAAGLVRDQALEELEVYGEELRVSEEDLRASQAALEAEEQRLSVLMDIAAEPIFTLAEKGIIESANRAAGQVFRCPPEDLIGQSFGALAVERFRRELDLHFASGSRRENAIGQPVMREFEALRPDKSTFPVELSSNSIRLGDRRIFITILRDLTEQRAAQERLAQDSALLERKVAERSATLQAEMLRHRATALQLEHALAEKSMLLREVHHRVKNSLQLVTSLLSMQARKSSRPMVKAELEGAIARIASVARTHELLYESTQVGELDFADYAERLCSSMGQSFSLAERGIALTCNAVRVSLNAEQTIALGLILNELVMNAIRHAFPDGRRGRIGVTIRSDHGQVALSVVDDGIGIADAASAGSSGLGTSLIELLASQIQGQVRASTGTGRSVVVTVPEKPSSLGKEATQRKMGDRLH